MSCTEHILWKQNLHDALLELDPEVFREKVDIATNAIKRRLSELQSTPNPDRIEMSELRDGLYAVMALGFLTQRARSQ